MFLGLTLNVETNKLDPAFGVVTFLTKATHLYTMQHNPILILLLWIISAFLMRGLLIRFLKHTFPAWFDKRKRDAESVASGAAFLLALGFVVAIFLSISLLWPTA